MSRSSSDHEYDGLLVIGDPHLEGRQPDFRKDDFPDVVLGKVEWCLEYAREHNLLPAFLGDMFQNPRDNPTWMLSRLIDAMKDSNSIGIFGNHDCAETTLNDNDSLMLLIKSRCLKLVDYQNPWRGQMNGRKVVVGGSSYRMPIPEKFEIAQPTPSSLFDGGNLVVWLTHHDIEVPGYAGGQIKPTEIENVDLVINGHIHKQAQPIQCGQTQWLTPGNITRRNRSDRTREHIPHVTKIAVGHQDLQVSDVELPHRPFEEVFYEAETSAEPEPTSSGFVSGLKEFISRRTQSGAGLHQFLEQNLVQFEQPVADEIRRLAHEITQTEIAKDD